MNFGHFRGGPEKDFIGGVVRAADAERVEKDALPICTHSDIHCLLNAIVYTTSCAIISRDDESISVVGQCIGVEKCKVSL